MMKVTDGECDGQMSSLSPSERLVKNEPIMTRSVAAKEAAVQQELQRYTQQNLTPSSSTSRLRQKSIKSEPSETAEGLASGGNDSMEHVLPELNKLQMDCDIKQEAGVSDTSGSHMFSVSDSTDVTQPLLIQTKFSMTSPGPCSSSTETASEVASLLSSPTISNPNSAQCSPDFSPEGNILKSSTDPTIAKMQLVEKLARARQLQVQMEGEGAGSSGRVNSGDCGEALDSVGEGNGKDKSPRGSVKFGEDSPDGSGRKKTKFGSHQGFTPKVCRKSIQ